MTRLLIALASVMGLAAGALDQGARHTLTLGLNGLVEIPGGPFMMGAALTDPDAFENERWPSPTGTGMVDVPAFYIARREITAEEFAAFVRETNWRVDPRALSGERTRPVTHVSWPDALAYCRWLEAVLKQSGAPSIRERLASGWRVTLPTEAEWEKAARTIDGFDVRGNLWEWTRSPYQPYPYDETDDRANLDADALWVIRGGHYGDGVRKVRLTARTGADPGARRPFIGFRVAISAAARRLDQR